MRFATWCVLGAIVALGACASAQPVPLGDEDLNGVFGKGALAQSDKATLTFFGDKTVSRQMTGSDQIDDGTWRVDGGKLCITWKSPATPESCLSQVRVGNQYEARNADGSVAMTYRLK